MNVFKVPSELGDCGCPVYMAAGYFDGLHTGHARVIGTAVESARAEGGISVALTFDRHPLHTLAPFNAPPMLLKPRRKLAIMESLGIDSCLMMRFDADLAEMTPDEFVGLLKTSIPTLRGIVVGENWKFGKGGSGTADVVRRLAAGFGFDVRVVPPVLFGGSAVSSTRIRREIMDGNPEIAAEMLGRYYSFDGRVEEGDGLARSLGYPTANLAVDCEVMPAPGVYAVMASLDGSMREGVLTYGVRPTIPAVLRSHPAAEVHLLDFSGDIYGCTMEVFLVGRIRDEIKFGTVEELKMAISSDIQQAKKVLQKTRTRFT